MPLITLIEDELKAYCTAATIGITIDAIAPSIAYCERKYIKPELGTAQYEALVAAYEASVAPSPTEMSAEEQALWEYCVRPLANLAVWHYAAAIATEISDGGMRERTAEDGTPSRLWVTNLQRDTLFNTAMDEIDNLLAFLDENKADYPDWVEGTGYAGLKSNLLQTTAQFNGYVHIDESRKLFKLLKPSIKKVEYLKIRREISVALYERLLAGLAADDLTADEQTAIDKLIPAIAHLAIANCELPVNYGPEGFFYLSYKGGDNDKEKTPVNETYISAIKRDHEATGKQYLNEAIHWLNQTASNSTLTEYFESDKYQNPDDDNYDDLGDNNSELNTIFSL